MKVGKLTVTKVTSKYNTDNRITERTIRSNIKNENENTTKPNKNNNIRQPNTEERLKDRRSKSKYDTS